MVCIPGYSERFKSSNIHDKKSHEWPLKSHNTLRTKTRVNKKIKANVIYGIRGKGDKTDRHMLEATYIHMYIYVGTAMTKLRSRLSCHRSELMATLRPIEQKIALAVHCVTTGQTPKFDDVDINFDFIREFFLIKLTVCYKSYIHPFHICTRTYM